MMTNDVFRDWAVEAWQKEVLKNMPSAKAARKIKASQRESRKALASARRSMAAQQAATLRKLDQRQVDIEKMFRERRESRDREFEQRRWDLLMGQQ